MEGERVRILVEGSHVVRALIMLFCSLFFLCVVG